MSLRWQSRKVVALAKWDFALDTGDVGVFSLETELKSIQPSQAVIQIHDFNEIVTQAVLCKF